MSIFLEQCGLLEYRGLKLLPERGGEFLLDNVYSVPLGDKWLVVVFARDTRDSKAVERVSYAVDYCSREDLGLILYYPSSWQELVTREIERITGGLVTRPVEPLGRVAAQIAHFVDGEEAEVPQDSFTLRKVIPRWLFLSFDTRGRGKSRPKVVERDTYTYESFHFVDDSSDVEDPHFLAILYASKVIPEEFDSFLISAMSKGVPTRVFFHNSQLGLVEDAIRKHLSTDLQQLSKGYTEGLTSLQWEWRQEVGRNTVKDCSPDDVTDIVLFRLEKEPIQPVAVSDTGEEMMPSVKQCEEYVTAALEGIKGVSKDLMDNIVLLRRDVLFYSWRLQKRRRFVPKEELIHLIGTSLELGVEAHLANLLGDGLITYPEAGSRDFLVKDEMLQAIENVLSDPLHFNITSPVPFFPDGVKGFELVEYFNEMVTPPPMPLPDMMRIAFRTAFGDSVTIKPLDGERGIFLVARPKRWNLMIYARSIDGAVNKVVLNELIVDMLTARGRERWDGLIFAPNSENIEVYKRAAQFPGVHHVWSITAVRFFNLLSATIEKHGAGSVSEVFDAIVPDDGESFSAGEAIARLEGRLGQ